MLQRIGPEDRAHFDYLIGTSPEPDFAQTAAWAELKSLTWRPVHYLYQVTAGESLIAVTAWLRRPPLFPYSLAYAPRGPILLRAEAEQHLPAFWEELRRELRRLGAFGLKVDPAWSSSARAEQMVALGFRPVESDSPFGGTQPRKMIRQDISADQEELLASIPKKIRYNIRYPEKNGVTYRLGGVADIPGLMSVLRDTSRRKQFLERGPEYYERLLTAMGDQASLILGYYEDQVIAAGVTVVCGKIAWAVYGGMLRSHNHLRPYYGLNWQRMLWAKSRGAEVFDFSGVPVDLSESSPLYGLYTFKKSFGGELVEFIGEYEWPIRRLPYWFWDQFSPLAMRLFKALARRLRGAPRSESEAEAEPDDSVSGG